MKVVHIELPRYFTLTVKEFRTEVAAALEEAGHEYRQFDVNPNFWRWVLGLSTPHSPGDLFGPLLAEGKEENFWRVLEELRAHFLDIGKLYGVPVNLRGIQPPRAALDSSYAACALVADNFGCGLFANFFGWLEEELKFQDADLICFGLDSPEGVFWALQLASWLRAAGSKAHLCIASHGWENFSLIHHVEDLAKNSWFFGIVDSLVLYPEALPETLRLLAEHLKGTPLEALHNIAIKAGNAVRILQPREQERTVVRVSKPGYRVPDSYFASMGVEAGHLVYSMAMVRNKCFYKKCTFCVQIAKHISDNAYAQEAEVQRALAACAELARHGVTMVNFMDEAMRPADLLGFCAGILQRGLGMHWIGRMIAAANYSPELLAQMKRAGCVEILFGLETFDPGLSGDMGKISRLHEGPAETAALVERFLEAGLYVILSMIYEFPTERPEARAKTLANVERLCGMSKRVACIFNRFSLMHASAMYQKPGEFNIGRIEARLAENDLQYQFGYECEKAQPGAGAAELALMHRLSLGLPEERYGVLMGRWGRELLDMAQTLDYVSIGLRWRVRTDGSMVDALAR